MTELITDRGNNYSCSLPSHMNLVHSQCFQNGKHTEKRMMACFHSIPQFQALFLAHSRHAMNAVCVHMIAEQELAGYHPAWRALCGSPWSRMWRLGQRWRLWCLGCCPSELVPGSTVQRGLQHIRVLGFTAQCLLLPHLLGFGTVPISLDVLVVPHN